jgi:four helix bundle protein
LKDFRNLVVWDKAHSLTLSTYLITIGFPKGENYGLTSQIRRACASIPANIAEGCGRDGNTEFKHFLQIAVGSASELDYHFILARDLKILKIPDYENLNTQLNIIKRMLIALIKKIRADKMVE